MNVTKLRGRLLIHLLRRAQNDDLINLFELAEDCGSSRFATLTGLAELEQAGLVDAGRLRLTLPGLSLAVALDIHRNVTRNVRAEPDQKSSRGPSRARHAA